MARYLPLADPWGWENWAHLARVVEMPEDVIRTGDYSWRDVFEAAIAWADRQTARAKLTAEAVRQLTDVPHITPTTETGGSEGGTRPARSHQPQRDPNKPGRDRQSDIIAAIVNAGVPLTRPELIDALKLKTEGKIGHHLAWMVSHNLLVNIPQRGYWTADRTPPE
jgi:hypothetical protein